MAAKKMLATATGTKVIAHRFAAFMHVPLRA
jgi:hypothetical protein